MLDLSNNNATGHNFVTAYNKGGQRRLYLKRCEGTTFIDKTYPGLRARALRAGFHVGAYAFLHPLISSPGAAANLLLDLIELPLVVGRDLRPALDLEHGTPSPQVGAWAMEVAGIVEKAVGFPPVIYGSAGYLEACRFPHAPGPLWLAAYGRDDGKEHPVGMVPAPWHDYSAHQFTSTAHVVGIRGACDLSSVEVATDLEPVVV